MVTPRKRRTRHTDVLDIINGINRTSTRAPQKRRQTTPRAGVYDIPVTPEKPTEIPSQKEATPSSSPSPSANDGDSGPEPNARGPHQQPASEEDEEWVEAQEPSNDNDDTRDNEEEELGDPFQSHLNRFSDANGPPSHSSESSPSEVPEEESPDSPESRAESESEAASVPELIRESGPEHVSEARSKAAPDDRVAVVIRTRGTEHQADDELRNAADESPANSQYASVPETPPAQPTRSTRPGRTHADLFDHEYAIESPESPDQDDPEHEPENEVEEIHDTPAEIPTIELNQTENAGSGGGILRELRRWFLKEIDRSPMETDWKTLFTQGAELRHYRSKPMPEYLQESRRLIAHVREIYEEITESEQFSSTQEAQLENFRESIYADAKQIFEYASETIQDASVLDQFEAHLVPRMVTLVQFSFRTFTIIGRPAADQLHGTLDLALRCSVRVDDYRRAGYLPAQARSRNLHLPLKRLKAALKKGQLNDHLPAQAVTIRSEPQPSQLLTQSSISPSRAPWTPMEEEALLEGLRQYTGELCEYHMSFVAADQSPFAGNDRFLLIIRDLGHRFRDRTVRDLKAKSQEFRRQALRNRVLDQFPWL